MNIFPIHIRIHRNHFLKDLVFSRGICLILSTRSIFKSSINFLYTTNVITSVKFDEISSLENEVD